MRIIAGVAKGRRLRGAPGQQTRPLTDRVREALFSSLGDRVLGAYVLDLYAGTGSIGLEGLSRGAAAVTFVERDPRALAVLRRNVDIVGLGGEVVAADVDRFLATADERRDGSAAGSIDLAFVDPPYALALPSLLDTVRNLERLLAEEGLVVIHRRSGDALPPQVGSLVQVDARTYGDAGLWRFARMPR